VATRTTLFKTRNTRARLTAARARKSCRRVCSWKMREVRETPRLAHVKISSSRRCRLPFRPFRPFHHHDASCRSTLQHLHEVCQIARSRAAARSSAPVLARMKHLLSIQRRLAHVEISSSQRCRLPFRPFHHHEASCRATLQHLQMRRNPGYESNILF
jgi:hypothetical protein